jgi:hypothetical protein
MRRIAGLGVVVAALLALPAQASAAETLGELATPGACMAGTAFIQTGVASGNDYVANTGGVITAFSMNGGSNSFEIQLETFQPDPGMGASHYIPRARDSARTISAPFAVLQTVTGVHLPIKAGELLGVVIPATSAQGHCIGPTASMADIWAQHTGEPSLNTSTMFSGPGMMLHLNLRATIEPDADGDGFGDETQDKCPSQAAAQGSCVPPATPATTTTKKCKRKKKHSAAGAKKKRCKKHHRK